MHDGRAANQLERLGEELGRRGLRVTLAPEGADLVLEVINPRPYDMRTVRIIWAQGSFWWASGERMPCGGDLPEAADLVTIALQQRRLTWPAPRL
jgi:hypothetical protein